MSLKMQMSLKVLHVLELVSERNLDGAELIDN